MRLLNVHTFRLHTFHGDDVPAYAILSHTWLPDDEEVTFAALHTPSIRWRDVPGALKIDYLCQQAADDELDWAWIDTCCIDKTNSVELSEAINSMFRWYQKAQICYAYLVDVDEELGISLLQSRWWNRAWTLQELVAPAKVSFYDRNWHLLGTKADLAKVISSRSGIDSETLQDATTMHVKSVACKMSWAANRAATRTEDLAYSLLGILGVSLSIQYGEGMAAFSRLQKKILNSSNDQSLFVWGFAPHSLNEAIERLRPIDKRDSLAMLDDVDSDSDMELMSDKQFTWHSSGMFAESPSRFAGCSNIIFHHYHTFDSHVAEMNGALRMELLTASATAETMRNLGFTGNQKPYSIALLPCGYSNNPNAMIGIFLEQWTPGRFRRLEPVQSVFTFLVDCHEITPGHRELVWIDNVTWIERYLHGTTEAHNFHKSIRLNLGLPMEDHTISVVTQAWTFDQTSMTLHRHHNIKNRKRHLEIAVRRHKTSDYLIIVLWLGNRGDPAPDDMTTQGNKVWITRKASLDQGPWIDNGYGGLLYQGAMARQVSGYGVHVSLKTHQVFNHLISTLTIEPQD